MSERVHATGELMQALQQAAEMLSGKLEASRVWSAPADVGIRVIRARTGLSQPNFAKPFELSTSAVRELEQGRR